MRAQLERIAKKVSMKSVEYKGFTIDEDQNNDGGFVIYDSGAGEYLEIDESFYSVNEAKKYIKKNYKKLTSSLVTAKTLNEDVKKAYQDVKKFVETFFDDDEEVKMKYYKPTNDGAGTIEVSGPDVAKMESALIKELVKEYGLKSWSMGGWIPKQNDDDFVSLDVTKSREGLYINLNQESNY